MGGCLGGWWGLEVPGLGWWGLEVPGLGCLAALVGGLGLRTALLSCGLRCGPLAATGPRTCLPSHPLACPPTCLHPTPPLPHPQVQWAHMDIAGPVWRDKDGGATGYGAQLLTEWVVAQGRA